MHFVEAKGILHNKGGYNGMNIYRGCTHGCIYCDSRSLCYQFTHPFEDIEVKKNAPELLESALKSKRKCMIGTGSMSDPYMHCETQLRMTRKCLEIIDKYGFGLAIQTKSDRILEDIELLDSINKKAKCVVQITLTTYDDDLCRIIEPNVCNTKRRIKVLKEMQKRGIPTVVWMTPAFWCTIAVFRLQSEKLHLSIRQEVLQHEAAANEPSQPLLLPSSYIRLHGILRFHRANKHYFPHHESGQVLHHCNILSAC